MSTLEYAVIRFSPDRISGECLNIGIVAFSREHLQLFFKVPSHLGRLTDAFDHIHLPSIRRHLNQIGTLASNLDARLKGLEGGDHDFISSLGLSSILDSMMSDGGLSVWFSPISTLQYSDFESSAAYLYEVFVGRMAPERSQRARRDDKQLWKDVMKNTGLSPSLFDRYTFKVKGVDIQCEQVYHNGAAHVIEPVALDYEEASTIQDRLQRVCGKAIQVEKAPSFGSFTLLVADLSSIPHKEKAKKELDLLKASAEFVTVRFENEAMALKQEILNTIEHR